MPRHDGRIGRRIVVHGPSGSGKSTLADQLARALNVPHIELDALHHLPNWGVPPPDDFRASVAAHLDAATGGFVVDGNYTGVRDIVWERAETAVWLQLPFATVYPRLCRRTWRRVRTRELLWGTNRERWQDLLGWHSMFRYGITAWRPHRRRMIVALASRPPAMRLFILHSDAEIAAFVERAVSRPA